VSPSRGGRRPSLRMGRREDKASGRTGGDRHALRAHGASSRARSPAGARGRSKGRGRIESGQIGSARVASDPIRSEQSERAGRGPTGTALAESGGGRHTREAKAGRLSARTSEHQRSAVESEGSVPGIHGVGRAEKGERKIGHPSGSPRTGVRWESPGVCHPRALGLSARGAAGLTRVGNHGDSPGSAINSGTTYVRRKAGLSGPT
jgi:hypothetical protein